MADNNEVARSPRSPLMTGRREINTSVEVVDRSNVLTVLNAVFPKHLANRSDIEFLYKYYKGDQPILNRIKEIRPEINNKIVENRANAIVTFRVGYTVGKPVQYVSSVSDDNVSLAIARLNDMLRVAGKPTKDKQLVEWQMICGTGYRLILPKDNPNARVPFDIWTADPRNTFVVYMNDIAHTPLAGVYYTISDEQDYTYHIYTKDRYFKVEGWQGGKIVDERPNLLGRIPIIEYPLNMARMGAFETVLDLLDTVSEIDCDALDSIQQTVQSLLVITGAQLDENTTAETIRESGLIVLPSAADGRTSDIKIINEPLDQTQTQVLKQSCLDAIYQIAGIPSQGNGSTNDSSNNGAVILKNGWQGAETRAQDYEQMFREPEQRAIELIIDICERLSDFSLNPDMVDVKFTRRNYEDILSKSQTLVTMLGNDKIHPQCAYEASGLFVDVQDAYNMGMDWYASHGEVETEPPTTDEVVEIE